MNSQGAGKGAGPAHSQAPPPLPILTKQKHLSIPGLKIVDYLTDELIPKTPEEEVRQKTLKELIDCFNYKKEDIRINYPIVCGSSRKYCDIVVFHQGTQHLPENIFIVIETKKANCNSDCRQRGIAQLKSYLSSIPNAQYGIFVSKRMEFFEKEVLEGIIDFVKIKEIPIIKIKQRQAMGISEQTEQILRPGASGSGGAMSNAPSDLQRLLEEASIRKAAQEARDNPSAPGSKDLLWAVRIAELVLEDEGKR